MSSNPSSDGGEVLFVGAVSASIIGYEVRDRALVDELRAQGAVFALTASARAPYAQTREVYSHAMSAQGSSGKSSSDATSFEVLQRKSRSTGGLRFQRSVFVPVLLKAVAMSESEWQQDRERDAAASLAGDAGEEDEGEEDKTVLGYLSLTTHLTIQLSFAGEAGSPVPIAAKNVRIRSVSYHAANDLCSIVRVVVTSPTLEDCCAARRDAKKTSGEAVDGKAAICFSVMIRVISLGHTVGTLVDADTELQRFLGRDCTKYDHYRLMTRERTPYGSVPLSELYRLYQVFCEHLYLGRSLTRHVSLIRSVLTSSPGLRAAEHSFPHRWNALIGWGNALDTRMIGEGHLTPLLLTLSHCTNLRVLRLVCNGVSDASCARICALFSHHRYLCEVRLKGNEIYEVGADAILRLVRRNRRIVKADLDDNPCSDTIRRRVQKVALQNDTLLRQDPLYFFSSQYSYLVSPASLPKSVLREAMTVWATLTAAPLGDVDVWPRNSTTEDMDHYVDESILPRLRDAQAMSDAPHSIIPRVARAPLLSELLRTVATAMQKAVQDPLVRALFTDVAQMEGKSVVSGRPSQREDSPDGGEEEAIAATGGEAADPVPPEVWTALQLKEEGQVSGPLMEVDELYSISFLRIIVTTFRTVEHQFDWEEVVDKLRKVGERQVELGVRKEDYWLAVHVFMRSLQLTLEGGDASQPLLTPEAVAAVLALLALGFRTAVANIPGADL